MMELEEVPADHQLLEWLFPQIVNWDRLHIDMHHIKRADFNDPCRTFGHLWKLIGNELAYMAEDSTNAQWQPVYDKLHQKPSALQRAPGQQKALANQSQPKARAKAKAKAKANTKTPGAPVVPAAP
eukprot:12080419-Karenia_brevis.AAC.1